MGFFRTDREKVLNGRRIRQPLFPWMQHLISALDVRGTLTFSSVIVFLACVNVG